MARSDQFPVGIDFGTLSGRAVVAGCPTAPRWATPCTTTHTVLDTRLPASAETLQPDWALQVPGDYREVLRHAVPAAVSSARSTRRMSSASSDFTACTMVPTLADGTPLDEVPGYADRPHAYVKPGASTPPRVRPTGSTSRARAGGSS